MTLPLDKIWNFYKTKLRKLTFITWTINKLWRKQTEGCHVCQIMMKSVLTTCKNKPVFLNTIITNQVCSIVRLSQLKTQKLFVLELWRSNFGYQSFFRVNIFSLFRLFSLVNSSLYFFGDNTKPDIILHLNLCVNQKSV